MGAKTLDIPTRILKPLKTGPEIDLLLALGVLFTNHWYGTFLLYILTISRDSYN